MQHKLYNMTPREIVEALDKYIIGQDEAKSLWQSHLETATEGLCFRKI